MHDVWWSNALTLQYSESKEEQLRLISLHIMCRCLALQLGICASIDDSSGQNVLQLGLFCSITVIETESYVRSGGKNPICSLVLRPYRDEIKTESSQGLECSFVSDVYVYGLMNGEAIDVVQMGFSRSIH